jgi:hypothetical protein
MCFSAQADVIGGLVVTAIGLDVVAHVNGRRKHMALAALPLLLGVHQLIEAFVWWGLQGHINAGVGRVATWVYLLIAFVVLPVFVPLGVMWLEPDRRRRSVMLGFVVLGAVVATVLLAAMVRGPAKAVLGHNHLSYSTDLRAGLVVVAAYVVATCGSLIISSYRDIAVFGIVNLVAVAVIARLTIDGFASLWCGWAALASAAFAVHLRYGRGGTNRIIVP